MPRPSHNWAGARLPRPSAPPPLGHDAARDPAQGRAVRRCRTCGLPGKPDEPLLEFELLLLPGRIPKGRYTLCPRCHRDANPPNPTLDPRIADPLDATDAA